MKEHRGNPLRGVRIRPASQIGLEDEPIPYSNGPVNNDEALTELLQISRLLTQIAESLARIEEICTEVATRQSSLENVQTVYPSVWGQKQDQARQLLMDLLEDHPEGVNVKRIRAEAAIMGISMRTMKEVKQRMGLKSEKHGTSWRWKWPGRQ